MRLSFWMGVVLGAGIASSAQKMHGQAADPAAGGGQGRQRGGGFGGQPVQGTVTAANGGKLTIQTDAGDSYVVTVTDTTRVMKDRQAIKLTDVKVGDGVTAMGAVDTTAKTVAAMMVMDVDAATMKQAKEDMGKTYITGKIAAIDADNLKLTVMRSDGVSQVISVDDGTSFQRGPRGITVPSMMGGMGGGARGGSGGGMGRNGLAAGATPAAAPESITMADIKVGDNVVASGGLKGGVFVPVKMGVSDAAAPGAGRRGGAGSGVTAQPGGPPSQSPPQ